MNFSDVLASSIHDVKNSLSMILSNLDQLIEDPETRFSDPDRANALRFEARRASNCLIQLLTLYKLDREQLVVDVAENNVAEFLDEIAIDQRAPMAAQGIVFEQVCDEWLTGYFDDNLVRGVILSAIGNAQRYTRERIRLSAGTDDGYLVIRIEDDGPGYPPSILEQADRLNRADTAFSSGSTQLGNYFAAQVAHLHTDGERTGELRLCNGGTLGGGCFELRLP